ncbi:hypothetical protein MMC14_000292 [Varicellaria rhodocarpa]|nr:hypothetical protein [Varicellaria rhodocarpa]
MAPKQSDHEKRVENAEEQRRESTETPLVDMITPTAVRTADRRSLSLSPWHPRPLPQNPLPLPRPRPIYRTTFAPNLTLATHMGWTPINLPAVPQPARVAPVPVASAVYAAPTTTITAPVASAESATSARVTVLPEAVNYADLEWWSRQKLGDLARHGFVREGDQMVYVGRYGIECTISVTRVQGGYLDLRITFPFAATRTPSASTAGRRGDNRVLGETTGPHSSPVPPLGNHQAGPSDPRRNFVDAPASIDGAPQPGSSSWGGPVRSNVLGAPASGGILTGYNFRPAPNPFARSPSPHDPPATEATVINNLTQGATTVVDVRTNGPTFLENIIREYVPSATVSPHSVTPWLAFSVVRDGVNIGTIDAIRASAAEKVALGEHKVKQRVRKTGKGKGKGKKPEGEGEEEG